MSTIIHHIAAISSDLNRTIHFYNKLLGMRVIHKHSLFEGPKVCHFYWKEDVEHFFTFYHCPGLSVGVQNSKTMQTVSFSVASASFHYWLNRLQNADIHYTQKIDAMHHSPTLCFFDPDGLSVQLVFTVRDERKGFTNHNIPDNFSIKGFYAVEISSTETASIKKLLHEQFGLQRQEISHGVRHFCDKQLYGSFIDTNESLQKNDQVVTRGMVHHIALLMNDWEACERAFLQIKISKGALVHRQQPNEFSSLYFREGEAILFELLGKMPATHNLKGEDEIAAGIVHRKKKVEKKEAFPLL